MKLAELISITASHVTVIAGIGSGSQSDLSLFFDTTSQLVFALVGRMVGDQVAAEEIASAVYWQVWKQAASYDSGHEQPLTWLLRLARQEALDYLRTNGRMPLPIVAPMTMVVAVGAVNAAGGYAEQQRVSMALNLLPAEQLQSLEMAYFVGLSYHEIAAELQCSPDMIRKRIGAAITGLRANLIERSM